MSGLPGAEATSADGAKDADETAEEGQEANDDLLTLCVPPLLPRFAV